MRADIEKIFHQVVDLPGEARNRYFRKHAVDRSVRHEVETLIAFASESSASLESDIGRAAEFCLAQSAPVGRLSGPYRLRRALAYGGTGTVYLAERTNGEAAETVAVKLFRPDLDNWNLRPRFRSEAHILRSLSHPYIVRLFESSHGNHGLPYLVMEYIDGATIEVCGRALSISKKIGLFLKICSAVAYLHRNLVIHGDLKPANIMVTKAGEPRLLDFGNARVTGERADVAANTICMLTPDYASPEQVAGEEISTASDIYSL